MFQTFFEIIRFFYGLGGVWWIVFGCIAFGFVLIVLFLHIESKKWRKDSEINIGYRRIVCADGIIPKTGIITLPLSRLDVIGCLAKFNKNNPLWQSNYHDHIIRNEIEFKNISEYIIRNPIDWKENEKNK